MEQPFISWAEKQLGGNIVVNREVCGNQSTVYNLATPQGNYFLKIAPDLEQERQSIEKVSGKLPVPKVIAFACIGDKDALLLSALPGDNLKKFSKEWPVEKIIDKMVETLRELHNVNTEIYSDDGNIEGKVIVHGDACLPNFIFEGDKFSGFVDLGDMRVDDADVDLAAAVWSLDYNFGKGHGLKFLDKYGVKNPTEEMVENLEKKYEEMQKKWGLL
ncbi:MAG: phosphotransferase [Patescibacteria group bacterium]